MLQRFDLWYKVRDLENASYVLIANYIITYMLSVERANNKDH